MRATSCGLARWPTPATAEAGALRWAWDEVPCSRSAREECRGDLVRAPLGGRTGHVEPPRRGGGYHGEGVPPTESAAQAAEGPARRRAVENHRHPPTRYARAMRPTLVLVLAATLARGVDVDELPMLPSRRSTCDSICGEWSRRCFWAHAENPINQWDRSTTRALRSPASTVSLRPASRRVARAHARSGPTGERGAGATANRGYSVRHRPPCAETAETPGAARSGHSLSRVSGGSRRSPSAERIRVRCSRTRRFDAGGSIPMAGSATGRT